MLRLCPIFQRKPDDVLAPPWHGVGAGKMRPMPNRERTNLFGETKAAVPLAAPRNNSAFTTLPAVTRTSRDNPSDNLRLGFHAYGRVSQRMRQTITRVTLSISINICGVQRDAGLLAGRNRTGSVEGSGDEFVLEALDMRHMGPVVVAVVV